MATATATGDEGDAAAPPAPAAADRGSAAAGSWTSWLSNATTNTLGAIQADLSELGESARNEAARVAAAAGTSIKKQADSLHKYVSDESTAPAPATAEGGAAESSGGGGSGTRSQSMWSMVARQGKTLIYGIPPESDDDEEGAEGGYGEVCTSRATIGQERMKKSQSMPADGTSGSSLASHTHQLADDVSHAWSSIKGTVAPAAENIMQAVSSALYGADTTEGEEAATVAVTAPSEGGSAAMSRSASRIFALQCDRATYERQPADADAFHKWCEHFSLSEHQCDIDSLLSDNAAARRIYDQLVPSALGRDEFWRRYFYRLHALAAKQHQKQQKQQAAKQPAAVDASPLHRVKQQAAANRTSGNTSEGEWSLCSDNDNANGDKSKAKQRVARADDDGNATPTAASHRNEEDWVDWDDE